MSLEQHSIDQTYRDRLGNIEVAPPAHAWTAIASRLPNEKTDEKGIWWWGTGGAATRTPEEKSKRERLLFWWWTGALVTLAAISMLAYYGLNATSTTNNNAPQAPQTSPAALIPSATPNEQEVNENLNLISTTEEDNCPKTLVSKENTPTAAIASSNRDAKAKPRNNFVATQALNVTTTKVRRAITSKNTAAPVISNPTAESIEIPLLTDTKTPTSSSPIPPKATDPVGLSLASIAMTELPFSDLTEFRTEAAKLPFGPGVSCPDFNNSADWSFAVRLFAGPGTVFQDYTSTAQTAAYATLRDSVENKQLSMNGGLRFEAVSSAGLFLRAGADYQMYRSNIEYLGPPRSRTVIDSVFMEDTQTWRVETRNETFREQRTVYNRHHAVVLTAGVGFRKTFGNVSPYIMAEAGYELLFKQKGNFILSDGNFVDLAEDNQGLYINDRPGFQYGGVLGVDFALTDRIELGLSGHYKQLGGLRGSADMLDFDQSTAFGALNLRYTIR